MDSSHFRLIVYDYSISQLLITHFYNHYVKNHKPAKDKMSYTFNYFEDKHSKNMLIVISFLPDILLIIFSWVRQMDTAERGLKQFYTILSIT